MPLTSLSAECVVSHLEPNIRLMLRRQCPGFNKIESPKSPLHIRLLKTRDDVIIINDTTYKLGVVTLFKDGKTPDFFNKKNSEGGVPWDLDEFGFRVGVLPPDLNSLSTLEDNLKNLKENINYDQHEPVTDDHRISWESQKEHIEELETNIALLRLKRDNEQPMIERYIQLLVIDKNQETLHKERLSYNKTFPEARSHLLRKLFSAATKLEIQSFEPHSTEVMQIIMPVVEKPIGSITLFRVEELEAENRRRPDAILYDNPLIENCKKLIIPWGRTTLVTRCPRVHYNWWTGTPFFFTEMCMNDRYAIGHHFSMKFQYQPAPAPAEAPDEAPVQLPVEPTVEAEMKRLSELENGFESVIPETKDTAKDRSVTVENGEKQVNFYIEAIPIGETEIHYHFHGKVSEIGYATRRVNPQ